jgi:hypothetical protein
MLSYIDFLKKYSTIPNNFLDDFFNIFNETKINNSNKVINIEIVAKWLNIQNQRQ